LQRTLTVSGSSATSTQQASSEPTTNLSARSTTIEESSSPTTIPPENNATTIMNTTAPTTTIAPNNSHNSSFSTSPNTNSGNSHQGLQEGAYYQSRPFPTATPLLTTPLQQQIPLNSSTFASPSSISTLQSLSQPPLPLTMLPPSNSVDINTSPDTSIISAVDTSTGLNIQNGQTVPLLSSIILTFSSSELPIAGFQCSIDGLPRYYCTTPAIVDNKQLASVSTTGISSAQPSSNLHTFQVSAVDAAGNIDHSPASFEWNVINAIKTDPLASDTTAPDTHIVSAVDSNNAAVLNGSSTSISSSSSASPVASQLATPGSAAYTIVFSFAATDDSNIITGYECASYSSSSLPEQRVFVPCTSPVISQLPVESLTTSTEIGTGIDATHIFQVRAIDAAGNVDPSPATFQWIDTPTTASEDELTETGIGILSPENPIVRPQTLLPQLQTSQTLLPQLQTSQTLLPQLQTLPTSQQ
jgi:hypothetical protein